jgi:hypothetical protein
MLPVGWSDGADPIDRVTRANRSVASSLRQLGSNQAAPPRDSWARSVITGEHRGDCRAGLNSSFGFEMTTRIDR